MNINGEPKLIAQAFVKARAEIGGTVTKDAQGNFGRYATLAAITDATSAALSKHGLAIIQEAMVEADGVTIDTHLLHESGAVIEFGSLTIPLTNRTPQAIGSAITYARKYQWAAVCGLAADDDDAQAAQDATKPTQKGKVTPSGNNAPDSDGDVLFAQSKPKRTLLSDDQLETLTTLMRTYYGQNAGKEGARLAEKISTGEAHRIADLIPVEAEKMIAGLQKRISEAEQQIAQDAAESTGQPETATA